MVRVAPFFDSRCTYVDAVYCYRASSGSVGLFVGLSVTLVTPAKTAPPIELPFGLRTWVGPVVCAKTAELIGMPFGLWSRMGRRNHVLDEGP